VAEFAERVVFSFVAVHCQLLMSESVMVPNTVLSWSSRVPATVHPFWTEVPEREFEIE
jgi:hypothetical protein